ncbi:MAG: hypothetical protein D4R84_02785 [Rhodocyclaceae bacterium]|nr:MAG: hypothetical protein D4R84_02785 [Rhodocyclaceae bacterium]
MLIDKLVARGLRAQLRNGSLLTGQLFIALDFFPEEAAATVRKRHGRVEIPTVAGSVQELQTRVMALVRKFEKLPLEGAIGDARKALQAVESTLAATEKAVVRVNRELTPQAGQALADLSRTLSGVEKTVDGVLAENGPLQRDLRQTLNELSRAAESLRNLADYLERNPGALLRGRSEASAGRGEEPAQ